MIGQLLEFLPSQLMHLRKIELQRERWFAFQAVEKPRSRHKGGVGEFEVDSEATETSELHAQAERTQIQKREEKVKHGGGSGRERARDDGAYARGRTARGRERGWPTT